MVQFFRKIRFKSFGEHKLGKYLLYAIGEIVLVVVGILIALQINNANANKKQKAFEQEILKALRADFQSDILQLEDNIHESEVLIERLDQLLILFKKSQDELKRMPKDSLVFFLTGYATFNTSDGALSSLFMSGDISIITNDSLRTRLTNWPNIVKDAKEDEDLLVDKWVHEALPMFSKHHSYIKNQKFDLDGLSMFDDLQLQNSLFKLRSLTIYQVYLYKELDEEIDGMIDLLNKEIN